MRRRFCELRAGRSELSHPNVAAKDPGVGMQRSLGITEGPVVGCVAFHVPTNTLWWATQPGDLRSIRLADGLEQQPGSGYVDPAGLALEVPIN